MGLNWREATSRYLFCRQTHRILDMPKTTCKKAAMDDRATTKDPHEADAGGQQPIWQQIRASLAGEIAGGKRAGGSMLPTEAELSRQYGVNRHTVRRALRALAEDGLVRAEQGRGTFVQDVGIDYLIGTRTRFSENIRAQDFEPGLQVIGFTVCAASADVAEMLDIDPGTGIVETQTRRFADDRPVTVSTAYYAGIEPRRFEAALRQGQSVTHALAAFGLEDYRRKTTTVSARMPSASDAELLKQPRTRPILHVEAVSVLPDGTAVEFSRTRFASDRVQIVFEPDGRPAR